MEGEMQRSHDLPGPGCYIRLIPIYDGADFLPVEEDVRFLVISMDDLVFKLEKPLGSEWWHGCQPVPALSQTCQRLEIMLVLLWLRTNCLLNLCYLCQCCVVIDCEFALMDLLFWIVAQHLMQFGQKLPHRPYL